MIAKNMKLAIAGAALALTMMAVPAAAQLASPSVAAFGMGDNYTALARGYAAASWNPAGLGLAGNPGFSLTLLVPRAIAGLDPVTTSDLKQYEGVVVPDNVKQEWLALITEEGSQAGTGGGDVTWLALQFGPVALHASSSARAINNVSPGVAQLLMFGNADAQGNPQQIALGGSSVDLNSYSTVGASFGMPFSLGDGASRIAVGVTAKYTMGHVMAFSHESSGTTTTQPIAVNFSFPIVHTPLGGDNDDDAFQVNNGSGVGLDIGLGYEMGNLTLGAAVQNVVNTFAWDEANLRYRPVSITLAQNDYVTETDTQPLASAPAALREAITDMTFKPSVALGAALRQSERLTVAADARFGGTDGMSTRPPTHVGAGIEFKVMQFLPIRVGGAFVKLGEDNSGFQFGGGLGLRFGGFNLNASAGQRSTDLGKDTMFMVQVVSIGM